MQPITCLKLFLDLLMVLVFALLFNTRVFSGLQFHEITGLALGGVFIIHLALNAKWIIHTTEKVFSPKKSFKIKMRYIVDALLLLSMVFIVVSGIMISKTILVGIFKVSNERLFRELHIVISYVSLLLIGIHVGLSWNWVMNTFKRLLRIIQESSVRSKLAIAAVVLMLGFGSYTIYSQTSISKISITQSSVSENRPNGGPAGGRRGGGGREGGSGANVFTVLIPYLGLISVFATMTVYGLKRY